VTDYRVSGEVVAEVTSFMRDMDRAIEKLDEFGRKDVTARLGLDGIDHVKVDLDELSFKLDELDHKNVDINIDCDDHCLKNIERDAKDAESAIAGGGAGGGGGLMGAIALLGPALAPIGGVALGGIGAIAASAGTAAVGLGAFAAFAVPAIQSVVKESANLSKVQGQLAAATTGAQVNSALAKQKEILDGMSPSMTKAVKEFSDFKGEYEKLSKTLQPVIFEVFGKGLQFVTSVLKIAAPIAASVGKELSSLMDSLNRNLHAGDVAKDIKDLTDNAAEFVGVWMRSVGNFVVGIMNMLDAFLPLSKSFNGGMEDMSKRFRDWTAHLSENKGFQSFVKYVRDNTPTVLHLLGGIVTLGVNLAKALAPLGGVVLRGLTQLVTQINDFAKANPGAMKMVATIAAIGVAGSTLLGPLKGVFEFFGKIGPAIEKVGGFFAELLPEISEVGGVIEVAFSTAALGPLLAIVGGVGALAIIFGKAKDKAAFFHELSKIWDTLKKTGKELWDDLKPLWTFFKEHISGNFLIVLTNVGKAINSLMPLLKPLGIILGVTIVAALELLGLALRGVTDMLLPLVEAVSWVVKEILKPFVWLYEKLVGHSIIPDLIKGIIKWFLQLELFIPKMILGLVGKILEHFGIMPGKVLGFFSDMYHKAVNKAGDLVTWMKGLPGKIIGALGDTGKMLWNAGINIIKGLANGIVHAIPDALGGAMHKATKFVTDHVPWSPAKRGPLRDFPMEVGGANIVKMLASGIDKHTHLVDQSMSKLTGRLANPLKIGGVGGSTPGVPGQRASGATSGTQSLNKNLPVGTRIGVYVAPGGIQVKGGNTPTEKSISDQLTRVARFGAFGNGN
jgi:hypothetical protein